MGEAEIRLLQSRMEWTDLDFGGKATNMFQVRNDEWHPSEGLMGADRQGKCLANQRALVHVGEHQLTDSVHRFCAGGPACLEKISQPLNLDAYKKNHLGRFGKSHFWGCTHSKSEPSYDGPGGGGATIETLCFRR